MTAACLYRYGVRMADAQNPARDLANLRWRGQGVDRAIEQIEQSADQLTEQRLARLKALIDDEEMVTR